MRRLPIMLLLILLFAGFLSCRKNVDKIDPVIEITLPHANGLFNALDTIHITASVRDNEIITSVRVSVVFSNHTSLLPDRYFYPGKPEFYVDLRFSLDDPYIESGDYYIMIRAGDGHNEKNAFQPIRINGIPKEILSYYVPVKQTAYSTLINVLKTDLSLDSSLTLGESHCLSALDSRAGLYFQIDEEPSNINAYTLSNFMPEWIVLGAMPYPQFYDLKVDRGLFVCTANGDIWGYDPSGSFFFQTQRMEDFSVETFDMNDIYLVSENLSRSGQTRFLVIYYRSTGFEKNKFLINQDVVEFLHGSDAFIVLSNKGADILVSDLNPENNIMTELNILYNTSLTDAVKINDDKYLLATHKDIYIYERYLNRLSLFLEGVVADRISYEPLGSFIFAISGNQLDQYSYPGGGLVNSVSFEDEVLDFHVRYNK